MPGIVTRTDGAAMNDGESVDPQTHEDAAVSRRRARALERRPRVRRLRPAEPGGESPEPVDAAEPDRGDRDIGESQPRERQGSPEELADRAEQLDREEVVQRWLRYAHSEECHAQLVRRDGGQPFDQLRQARARVRREAAQLLADAGDVTEAARTMLDHARRLRVAEPPLVGFDQAMLAYTQARTWQACALELLPDADPVQPLWD